MSSGDLGYEARPDLAGKALSSQVWKHFKRSGNGVSVEAKCFYCPKTLRSQSHEKLRLHIINKHPQVDFETADKETHVKNYFAMENSQPTILIKSDPAKKPEKKILNEVKEQRTQQPIQEVPYFPTLNGPQKDRRLNFDVFEQNIGCAKVSMFEKKPSVKPENLGA